MKTLLKIIRHRDIVRKNIHNFISKLEERSIVHDLSKLQEDEYAGFAELDSEEVFKLYGTDEYKKKIAENVGIKLHYQRNTHHPEHFEDGSQGFTGFNAVESMTFLDILEMVIDWKSACETYGSDFNESIDYSIKRFNCTSQQEWIIKLIAKDLN